MDKEYLKYVITEDIYLVKASDGEETVQSTENKTAEQTLKVKGNEQAAVAILNIDQKNTFISAQDAQFLGNILKAIQLDLEKIALINMAQTEYGPEQVIEQLPAKKILSFGLKDDTFFQSTGIYETREFNQKIILNADDLPTIEKNKDKKKALWAALQSLFFK